MEHPESVKYSCPIQTEDKSSTNLSLSLSLLQGAPEVRLQYRDLSESNVELDIQQPQECSDRGLKIHTNLDADDLLSLPKLKAVHSLEDKFYQILVKKLPEIKKLEKQLEEQRFQQQEEMDKLKKQLEEQRVQHQKDTKAAEEQRVHQQKDTKVAEILLFLLLLVLSFIAYCVS